jgi:hypothetical protein
MLTTTGRHWRRRLRKHAGTGKRQEINMVRDIYGVVASASHDSSILQVSRFLETIMYHVRDMLV